MGKNGQLRPDTKFNLFLPLVALATVLIFAGVLALLRACDGL